MSRSFRQSTHAEFAGKIQRHCGLIYDAQQPIAAVATQSFDVRGDQFVGMDDKHHSQFVNEVRPKSLSMLRRRIIICGNVHTGGPHGVAFTPGLRIDTSDLRSRWGGVAERLYRIRRTARLHGQTDYVFVKDLFVEQHGEASELEPFRYKALATEPTVALQGDTQWQSPDN